MIDLFYLTPIDENLTGTTILNQSGAENKGGLCIL